MAHEEEVDHLHRRIACLDYSVQDSDQRALGCKGRDVNKVELIFLRKPKCLFEQQFTKLLTSELRLYFERADLQDLVSAEFGLRLRVILLLTNDQSGKLVV